MADVQAQLDGHPHNDMVVAIRVVLFITATVPLVICSMRLYVRWFVVRWFGLDDAFVIPALVAVLGWDVVSLIATFHGLGRHIWDLSPASLNMWKKDFFIVECTYLIVSGLMKTSVILSLMRIFAENSGKPLVICKSLIAFLVAFTVSGTLVMVFQCNPVRAAYTTGVSGSKCFSPNTMFGIVMYQAVTMLVTDVIILAIPMPVVWKLKLPLKKRIAVMILFGLGFIATIAALVRFSTLPFFKNRTDFSYTASSAFIWMGIEFCLGITTTSFPSLRLIITWRGAQFFTSEGSHVSGTGARSRLRRNPRNNTYSTQDPAGEFELNGPNDKRIVKTTITDVELGNSESTECMVTTFRPNGGKMYEKA